MLRDGHAILGGPGLGRGSCRLLDGVGGACCQGDRAGGTCCQGDRVGGACCQGGGRGPEDFGEGAIRAGGLQAAGAAGAQDCWVGGSWRGTPFSPDALFSAELQGRRVRTSGAPWALTDHSPVPSACLSLAAAAHGGPRVAGRPAPPGAAPSPAGFFDCRGRWLGGGGLGQPPASPQPAGPAADGHHGGLRGAGPPSGTHERGGKGWAEGGSLGGARRWGYHPCWEDRGEGLRVLQGGVVD